MTLWLTAPMIGWVLFVAWWMHSGSMRNISTRAQTTPCNCRYFMLASLGSGLITGLLGIQPDTYVDGQLDDIQNVFPLMVKLV